MRKASFKVVTASPHSTLHNSRQEPPKYLIDKNAKNDYILYYSDEEYLLKSQMKYLEFRKKRMQIKQQNSLIKETVLNLENRHTLNDVKNLFFALNKKFGGHKITELSLHRDEGYFILRKNNLDIPFYPSKHILEKEDGWYIIPLPKFLDDNYKPKKEDFTQKVDIADFEKIFNYHAHVKFSMYDVNTGLTGRMQKSDMTERLKFVAEFLNLKYEPQTKIPSGKKISHIKDEHDLNRRAKIKMVFQEMNGNKKKEQEQEQLLAKLKREKEEKEQLEKKNRELREQGQNDFLTELQAKEITHLKERIEGLEEQNKALSDENIKLQKKEHTSRDIGDLEKLKKENERLKEEIYELKHRTIEELQVEIDYLKLLDTSNKTNQKENQSQKLQ